MLAHLQPQRRIGLRLAACGVVLNKLLFLSSLFSRDDLSDIKSIAAVLLAFVFVGAALAHEARYFGLVNLYARRGD